MGSHFCIAVYLYVLYSHCHSKIEVYDRETNAARARRAHAQNTSAPPVEVAKRVRGFIRFSLGVCIFSIAFSLDIGIRRISYY